MDSIVHCMVKPDPKNVNGSKTAAVGTGYPKKSSSKTQDKKDLPKPSISPQVCKINIFI